MSQPINPEIEALINAARERAHAERVAAEHRTAAAAAAAEAQFQTQLTAYKHTITTATPAVLQPYLTWQPDADYRKTHTFHFAAPLQYPVEITIPDFAPMWITWIGNEPTYDIRLAILRDINSGSAWADWDDTTRQPDLGLALAIAETQGHRYRAYAANAAKLNAEAAAAEAAAAEAAAAHTAAAEAAAAEENDEPTVPTDLLTIARDNLRLYDTDRATAHAAIAQAEALRRIANALESLADSATHRG